MVLCSIAYVIGDVVHRTRVLGPGLKALDLLPIIHALFQTLVWGGLEKPKTDEAR